MTKCYLCDGGQASQRKGRVWDNPNAKINQCNKCGLVFLTGVDEVDYKAGGMHEGDKEAVHTTFPTDKPDAVEQWLRETRRDDNRRFECLSEQISGKAVLDFGCGAGGFLLFAQNVAESVTGVELDQRLATHFKTNGINVVKDIDGLRTVKKYDVITLFHVVEHLQDPRATLKELMGLLAPDGQIIVEVPSANDALLDLYKCQPFTEFTYWSCHLYLFNAATLERLAIQAGLSVNYVKHIQRYPLSNHLHWLAKGQPAGHDHWGFLDTAELSLAYENTLARIGKTDTLFASFTRK